MAASMGAHYIAKIGHANVKAPVDPDSCRCEKNHREKSLQNATSLANDALSTVGGDNLKASEILDLKLQATNEMIAHLAQNSQQLSDEDFYERLTTLKEEHRKTLDMCEHLYKMKSNANPLQTRAYGRTDIRQESILLGGDLQNSFRTRMETESSGFPVTQSIDYLLTAYRERDEWDESHRMAASLPVESRGPAYKPPTGTRQRPRTAGYRSRKPKLVWKETKASRLRRRCHSADNLIDEIQREEARGELQPPSPRSIDGDDGPSASTAAISRVHELWDEVQVEDMETAGDLPPPPGPLKRVRSLDRSIADYNRRKAFERARDQTGSVSREDLVSKWRHRITIPEPFNFSIRDENIPKTKNKAYEEEKTRREQEELVECQKKFKANPVPAHVYMPMYDSLMERQESRRQYVRQYRKEILQSTQEPFKFDQREEEKRRQKEMQGKTTSTALRSTKGERSKSVPRAVEIPSHLFEDRSERLREDQLLRQIKAKMRSDELLRKSSLPGQMAEREKAKKEKLQEKAAKTNTSTREFRPRTRNVPNFNRLHSKLAKEKGIHQGELRVTRPKPFRLRTDERVGNESKRSTDYKENEDTNMLSRRSYEDWNQSILLSKEIPPAQMTNSAIARDRRTKERLNEMRRRELEEEEQWRTQKRRQEEMARLLRENLGQIDAKKSVDDLTSRKTKELRYETVRRSREYGHDIRDMEDRIKNRPLLVERQAQLCAKKQAERKYASILKGAGVDETFVEDRGAAYRPEDADGYDQFNHTNGFHNATDTNQSFGGRIDEVSTMSLERDRDQSRHYPQENVSLSMSDRPDPTDDDDIEEDLEHIGSEKSESEFGEKVL